MKLEPANFEASDLQSLILYLLKEDIHERTGAGKVDGTNSIFCCIILIWKSLHSQQH